MPIAIARAGAGNMNLALRVTTRDGRSLILKQGRPWVEKYAHIPAPFERTIVASFGPRSVIELELTHRLAALFWRLRRASAIETGLFGLHSAAGYGERARWPYVARQPMKSVPPINGHGQFAFGHDDWRDPKTNARKMRFGGILQSSDKLLKSRILAQSFLHLAKHYPSLLERSGAHEARLWRQAAQAIWILDGLRRPPPADSRRSFRKPVAHYFWDWDR